jgi:photosystem II stability/assembly factor-like uncharacterized protein
MIKTRRVKPQLVTGFLALALGVVLFTCTALANVSVGHSGWTWGSPQPQGNDLNGIDFAGGRGYASGALGTLLRTDDGGQTWTGIPTGLTQPLLRVRAIDANTVVIGGGCALRRSDDGGATFQRLPWTSTDQSCPSSLASFSFPNAATGYLLTQDGNVSQTADGGQSFSRRTSVPGTRSAGGSVNGQDVFFTDANTGVALAGTKIFRTTDGASTWNEVNSGPALNAVTFVSATVGYAVGPGTTVLKTVDGGQTWNAVPLTGAPAGLNLTSLDCSDPQTCLIAEASGAQIVRTTDGGATGAAISPSTQPVFAVAFDSPTQAVAVGRNGTTVVSTNGGLNFSPVGGGINGSNFGPVSASPGGVAVAGAGNGILARSSDGGQNWSTVGVPTAAPILGASFPTGDVGYALDSHGGVFKTANAGSSWTVLNTGTTANARQILGLDANHVLLLEPKGLRLSPDGGASFSVIENKPVRRKSFFLLKQISAHAAFVAGSHQVAITTDGGQKWTNVPLPTKKFRVLDVDAASPKVVYASSTDRRLWKTTNGGKTWIGLPAVGPEFTGEISFSSSQRGFVQADFPNGSGSPRGFVLATKDGGQSWQPQLIAADPVNVWDGGSVAYANTNGGSFFSTTSRGTAGTPSKLTIHQTHKNSKTLHISGTLNPPQGQEQVFVSSRTSGATNWTTKVVTAASNGQFNTTFGSVKKPTFVVAQWTGDGDRAGAGTKVLLVEPPKKHHH